MFKNTVARSIGFSFAAHIALVVFCFSQFKFSQKSESVPFTIVDLVKTSTKKIGGNSEKIGGGGKQKIDLRPPSMQNGFLSGASKPAATGGGDSFSSFTKQQLHTDSKSLVAFDLLAAKIDLHLEYSKLLVENGVEGLASLDLYFDHEGNIDEARSVFGGDNSLIRGVLVRATRAGLVKWYLYDAHRLKKEQFRNQHFYAQFSLSAVFGENSELAKTAPNAYTFRRRRAKDYCLRPFGSAPGIDVSCVAFKAYGAIYNSLSRERRIKFDNLRDELEHVGRKNLDGINAAIEHEKIKST